MDCFYVLIFTIFLHFFQRVVLSNSNPICAASILISFKSMKLTTPPFDSYLNYNKAYEEQLSRG